MPISFECVSCGSPLKVKDELAGKRCKCPKCAAPNVIPSGDEDEAAEVVEEVPKPKKSANGVAAEPAKAKKPQVADDLEEADEPAEETAKGKKAKAKKPKAKKRSRMGLLLGLGCAALGVALVGCAGIGAAVFFIFFWSSTPDELRYLPSGTNFVSVARTDQIRNSQFYKDVQAELKGKDFQYDFTEKQFGLSPENFERITRGSAKGPPAESITVVRLKSPVQATDISAKLKQGDAKLDFTETKVGKYTVYEPKSQGGISFAQAFCPVDGRTVLYGQAKTIRAVLERDKPPEFSPAMQEALKRADFRKMDVKVADYSGDGPNDFRFAPLGVAGKKGAPVNSLVDEQQYGTDLTLRAVWTFKDAAAAADAKKDWEENVQKKKNEPLTKDFFNEIQMSASVSGSTLVIDGKITSKAQIKLLRGMKL